MKNKSFAIYLLLVSIIITQDVFGNDKALHFGVSSVGTVAIAYSMAVKRFPLWSIYITPPIVMLAAGVAKEALIDNKFDSGDMTANILGVFTGVGFLMVF